MRGSRLILPAIALVLSGMAIGVLVMQYIARQPAHPGEPEGRIVQSVQIGRPSLEVPPVLPDAHAINTVFKQVASAVTPTVVSVYATYPRHGASFGEQRFHDEEFLERYRQLPQRTSAGSGVIISGDGYVVTNNHVVEGAEEIRVLLSDKREFPADVVGTDPTTDLAVLFVKAGDLPVIVLGNSDDLEVGEWVVAVGNPFHLNSTVTQGIVSALGRQVDIISGRLGIEDFIQTDAAINPGNSGGALVDLQGRLVGVNTAIATEHGSYEGYGFAVPVNLVTHVVNDLVAYGEVRRGFLGIAMARLDARNIDSETSVALSGVLVSDVAPSGPAARAGLVPGDVILSVEGLRVDEPNQLQSRIARFRPGDVVTLEVLRDGESSTVKIPLVDRENEIIGNWLAPPETRSVPELDEEYFAVPPDSESPFRVLDEWGVVLREIDDDMRTRYGVEQGAYIAHVRKDTPADVDGLPRGVVITEIGGEPVASVDDAFTLLELAYSEERESVLFGVVRSDRIRAFYEVGVPSMD